MTQGNTDTQNNVLICRNFTCTCAYYYIYLCNVEYITQYTHEQHSHNTHIGQYTLQDKIYNNTCTDWLCWHSHLESRWGHSMTFCMKGKGRAHVQMQHMYARTPIYTYIRTPMEQTYMHTDTYAHTPTHTALTHLMCAHTCTHTIYIHNDAYIHTHFQDLV